MRGRVRRVSAHRIQPLDGSWAVARCAADAIDSTAALASASLDWITVDRVGPAASMLREAGRWSLDGPDVDFDADDWWFRTTFDGPQAAGAACVPVLCFDGIATLADVWLNDVHVGSSDNMFVAHAWPVAEALRARDNVLTIRCRSIKHALAQRRPRPRWRVPMVEMQALRWIRTTLLGRTPGWSPAAACVGPWGDIRLEQRDSLSIEELSIDTRFEGDVGVLRVDAHLAPIGDVRIAAVTLCADHGGEVHRASLAIALDAATQVGGELRIPSVQRWWPHTHGTPALVRVRLEVTCVGHDAPVVVDLGSTGFRDIALDRDGDGFALRVNGTDVWCRGVCWMPIDGVALRSSPESIGHEIARMRAAGFNMLRVCGTAVVESDAFYDACDAQGMLVWQDLMFANFDYPFDDARFEASAQREITQQLARWQARPCIAVMCGNSEASQQAAMWGAPRAAWHTPWFETVVRDRVSRDCAGAVYWPSSAAGGAFAHQADAGTTSYYGVGAYRRPIDDARTAGVRFATECLAFANVAEPSSMRAWATHGPTIPSHPLWKRRGPRDLTASWDFDDVRDHYLAQLYHVDATALRASDVERYLALSRAVMVDVMEATFSIWRCADHPCAGALVWFSRDLWPAHGWGLIDSLGQPKSAWYGLARAAQPVALLATDEGCNGMRLHVVNDPATPLDAELNVRVFNATGAVVAAGRGDVHVPAHASRAIDIASYFDQWLDLTYAYRFGPQQFFALDASLVDRDGHCIGQLTRPLGPVALAPIDLGWQVRAARTEGSCIVVEITTQRFARSVAIDVSGYVPDDHYFHVAPGATRRVMLRPAPHSAPGMSVGSGIVTAINAQAPCRFEIRDERV